MCTVSWLEKPGGYELFFNRDELRSRSHALLPGVHARQGLCFVAPTDVDSAGTWLAVNEKGLSVGLLNFYDASDARGASRISTDQTYTSRGSLVVELIAAQDRQGAIARLAKMDLTVYRPFTLLLIDPSEPVRSALRWDGETLRTLQLDLPFLTSSSYDVASVEPARREQWEQLENWTPARLRDLHRSHQPQRGPYSPCMHRPDALTVSFSWIQVDSHSVSFTYSDGPPCQAILEAPVELLRS